jgi:hypothetical protein
VPTNKSLADIEGRLANIVDQVNALITEINELVATELKQAFAGAVGDGAAMTLTAGLS